MLIMEVQASKSRVAQEKLQALEKQAATFEQQLVQAAIFVGKDLCEIRRYCSDPEFVEKQAEEDVEKVVYHGREEWLLRWLLKKLQAPKDDVPRKSPSSWWLLYYLLQHIPLINVAQILLERKFISIIQLVLEEAEKRDAGATNFESSSTEQEAPAKSSKKRKRSGELVAVSTSAEQADLPDLIVAILTAVGFVVDSTKASTQTVEQGRSSAFIAESMKTVIRTSAEAAAKILGSWLSLCQKALPNESMVVRSVQNHLSPFIEIWQCHIAEEPQYLQFSLHVTKPLLSLLRTSRPSSVNWTPQLEALVARNIIVPTKTAMSINAASDMLSSLTRISVIQDSENAAILFDIAIRCTQSPGARKRRRQQDDTWLASVFSTLNSSMPIRASNAAAVSMMLQSAIQHKVNIDLNVLREIVWEYGLPKESEDWRLVATVLVLDGNVFLIPDETELLRELLERITKVSVSENWSDVSDTVVKAVLVPLMREFARARDLSGFVKHWHEQLVAFEKQRKLRPKDMEPYTANLFSAWEDEELQTELKALLEPSLTIPQIGQILDWLQGQVSENPDATCIILEAVARSISGDEHVVDAVSLRMYHIMFDNDAADTLDTRYRWRSWRIISRTLAWLEHWDTDKLSMMWKQGQKPFDTLLKKRFKHLFEKKKENSLETLEIMTFACTAWEAADAEKEGRLKSLATGLLGDLLKAFAGELKTMLTTSSHEALLGGHMPHSCTSVEMNPGWLYWSFVRCLLVEHPKALE
jgi:nucleolar pre-ribosomal-associated protein 2